MKTPYTVCWIALDALGPEDDDAELRACVSVDLDERDQFDQPVEHEHRPVLPALARHCGHGVGPARTGDGA
ncbi:hypothetical protein [Massilia sp. PWRC2]|uniref:hypothetical protein n=1 Tax=Massilia sp. PWRC2 TaxID=2804626 RepID=UPI003CF2C441